MGVSWSLSKRQSDLHRRKEQTSHAAPWPNRCSICTRGPLKFVGAAKTQSLPQSLSGSDSESFDLLSFTAVQVSRTSRRCPPAGSPARSTEDIHSWHRSRNIPRSRIDRWLRSPYSAIFLPRVWELPWLTSSVLLPSVMAKFSCREWA